MTRAVHVVLIAMLVWLPISQAVALCCPSPVGSVVEINAAGQSAEHCSGEHETEATPETAHDASCFSACVLLSHVPLPAVVVALGDDDRVHHSPTRLRPALQTGHRFPLLRPPSLLRS